MAEAETQGDSSVLEQNSVLAEAKVDALKEAIQMLNALARGVAGMEMYGMARSIQKLESRVRVTMEQHSAYAARCRFWANAKSPGAEEESE